MPAQPEIPDAVMRRILADCGQHTVRDPHYHCTHCGGEVHWTEHFSRDNRFTCEPHPEAVPA